MKEIILKGTFVKEEDGKKIYKFNMDKLEWRNFYNIDDDLYVSIKKAEILNDTEKEYLKAVIKPFRDRVEYIKKCGCYVGEYIEIVVNDETIDFPYFEKNTMYEGMEQHKEYTLKELGL